MWSSTSRSWLSINKFLQLNAAKNNVLQLLKILSFPFISKMLSSSVWPYFKLYLNPAPLCVIGQMLLLVSSLRAGLLQCTIQGINLKVRAVVSGSWRDWYNIPFISPCSCGFLTPCHLVTIKSQHICEFQYNIHINVHAWYSYARLLLTNE